MYTKTTKRYRKKLKRTGINGKTPHVHGLDDNTVRMPTLQDFFFFGRHKNLHSKIQMDSHRIPNSQDNLEKKEQNWRTHIS